MVESCVKRRDRKTCLRFKVAGETRRALVDAMCPLQADTRIPVACGPPGGSSRLVELWSSKRVTDRLPFTARVRTESLRHEEQGYPSSKSNFFCLSIDAPSRHGIVAHHTPCASRCDIAAMFVCRACARRASTPVIRQIPNADGRLAALPRQFVTSSFLRQGQGQEDGFAQFEASVERQKTPSERQAGKKKALDKAKRAMKKELQYTTDPYHIADNVVKKLKENDFDKALLLTREASKDKQCVVSWNHCIEYQFKNNKLHAAIKLFNEVGDLQSIARLLKFRFPVANRYGRR